MLRRHRTLIAAYASLFGLSCGILGPYNCTAIGCDDGLIVELASPPPAGTYSVQIIANGVADTVHVFTCYGQNCLTLGSTPYHGGDPLIRVTTSAGVKDTQLHGVHYTALYPNGKRCGAACQQATVTVPIP